MAFRHIHFYIINFPFIQFFWCKCMNILVSDSTVKYNSWLVVRTLKDALAVVGAVEGLVFHKSKESSEEKMRYITELSKKHTSCKIVYLCSGRR